MANQLLLPTRSLIPYALSKINFGDLSFSDVMDESDKSYEMRLDGGLDQDEEARQTAGVDCLSQYRSLPPIFFTGRATWKMYYEFVPILSWLKEAPKRAKALKEAFVHLYCQPEVYHYQACKAKQSCSLNLAVGSIQSPANWETGTQ